MIFFKKSYSLKRIVFVFDILIGTAILLIGCKAYDTYPNYPQITFKDAYVIPNYNYPDSTSIVLTISYKDGNGNIGLGDADTLPPYNQDTLGHEVGVIGKWNLNRFASNLWIDYCQKFNGVYMQPVKLFTTLDTIRDWDKRVGILTPDGNNKAIRGDIQVTLSTLTHAYPYRNDTVKFKVRLIDRALNISNQVESPDILVIP